MTGKEGGTARDEPGQGFDWQGDDPLERAAVIEAAFDYRGDVTLSLRSGEELAGYLANRDSQAEEPFVEVFPAAGGDRQRVAFDEICGVSFTGRDTASGKSWESWVRRWKAKQEARSRGEDIGEIGLFPDPLD